MIVEILLIIFGIIALITLIWAITVYSTNDLFLPSLNLRNFINKENPNILVIFPHPDDETMASGGLISKFNKLSNLTVVTVTKGQYGTELLNLAPTQLAQVREKEFKFAMQTLNVHNYEAWEFIDGTLADNLPQLKDRILDYIKANNIDLVVTYERSGIYGHPDHIALSKVTNQITKENDNIKVLYATLPAKILKRISLPTHINGTPIAEFKKQSDPEYKLFIFNSNLTKLKAAKGYKSQNLAHGFPLELMAAVGMFEYYTTSYED